MKLELCDFELSKLLVTKGFDLDLTRVYNNKGISRFTLKDIKYPDIPAPTLELAKMWFMEVHNIIVIVDYGPLSEKFSWEIYQDGIDKSGEYVNGTYNQALSAGLKEACKLIKT